MLGQSLPWFPGFRLCPALPTPTARCTAPQSDPVKTNRTGQFSDLSPPVTLHPSLQGPRDLPPPHSLTRLALFSLLPPGQARAYPRALACAVEGLFARCLWACSLISFRSSRPHLPPLTLLACSACCPLTSFMWGLISISMPQISSHHFIFIHQEGT